MPDKALLAVAKNMFEQASVSIEHYSGLLGQVQQLIVNNFGENGLYAAYFSLAALSLLLVWKLIKLSLSALKYMVLPAVGLAVIGAFFMPYSFTSLLPITATGCSLVLLFKG